MCGFVGIYSKNLHNIRYSEDKLKNLLSHRGPDHSTVVANKNLLFVHNRLSIIDLSADANQPFVSEDTSNILLYNGEIYNYSELKKKYKDIKWKTNSDTEVIIKLYDLMGPLFVEELNGIFSFVIYDKINNKLLLYRDRVGVKPIYYKKTHDTLYFSSEIKGILYFLDNYTLDYNAVYDYVEYSLTCHNDTTFIEGVYTLEPGTYLELNLDNWKCDQHVYWDVGCVDLSYKSEDEIYEEALFLLQDSVRLNLVSDVEIGLSLSSGLDSTLLFCLLEELGSGSIRSFTYGFKEKEYDEVERIYENQFLKTHKHQPVYFDSQDMLDTLKEALYFFEAPIGGLGTVAAYNMMKNVNAANIKVMIAGEGADEVFGGYQYYFPAFFKDIEYDMDLLKRELHSYNSAHNCKISLNSHEYHQFIESIFSKSVLSTDGTSPANTYCSDGLIDIIQNNNRLHRVKKEFLSTLKTVMCRDLKEKKLPKLLLHQDRASMANSVETRVPYLDHRLIELMYAAPSENKIKNGKTKHIARRILSEHFGVALNTDLKHYVSTPQREWIKKELYNNIVEILREGMLMKTGLVNFEKFFSDYKQYSNEEDLGNSFFVWKMLNLEFLLNIYFKDSNIKL